VNLATDLKLVPRLRICGSPHLLFLMRLRGSVLNWLNTGRNLPF
jgi:hypothetical protein